MSVKVKVLIDHCTLGARGDIVTPPPGVHVRALVRSRAVEIVADKKPTKKAAAKKKGSD